MIPNEDADDKRVNVKMEWISDVGIGKSAILVNDHLNFWTIIVKLLIIIHNQMWVCTGKQGFYLHKSYQFCRPMARFSFFSPIQGETLLVLWCIYDSTGLHRFFFRCGVRFLEDCLFYLVFQIEHRWFRSLFVSSLLRIYQVQTNLRFLLVRS